MKTPAALVAVLLTACGGQPSTTRTSSPTGEEAGIRDARPDVDVARVEEGSLIALPGASYRVVANTLRRAIAQGARSVTLEDTRELLITADVWNPYTIDSDAVSLRLSIVVSPAGFVVSGSGGTLAPGCTRIAMTPPAARFLRERGDESTPEVTRWPIAVEPPGLADGTLTECLRSISAQFPEERRVIVSAHADIPWSTIAQLLEELDGGPFPEVVLSASGPCRLRLAEPCVEVTEAQLRARARAIRVEAPPVVSEGLLIGGLVPGAVPAAPRVSGRVEPGQLRVETGDGGAVQRDLVRMVRRRLPALRRCYEAELTQNADLSGSLSVQFLIEPQGTVRWARVIEDEVGSAPLARCVTAFVRRIRLRQGPQAAQTFVYPFVFKRAAHETP